MNVAETRVFTGRPIRRKLASAVGATLEALEGRTLLSTVVVNAVSDSATGAGVVTLSDAVAMANASASATTITFDPTVFAALQTIVAPSGGFSSGQAGLDLDNTAAEIILIGPAAGVIIDNANFASNVCTVLPNVTASLSNMTLEGAGANYCGVRVDAQGTVSLTDVALSGNNAGAGGGAIGGGITNDGTATLADCTISGNASERGGGLYNVGAATLTDVTISGNSAYNADGGVQNTGSITLTGCTITGNNAAGSGGGISTSGTMSMTDCTVSDNSANIDPQIPGGGGGGGIYSTGHTTLTDSTVSGNTASGVATPQDLDNDYDGTAAGGGIYNFGAMTVTDSTVSGNVASGVGGISAFARGGGIDNDGTRAAADLTMINSTVSGNTAVDQGSEIAAVGGGVDNSSYGNFAATATLSNVTVSGNSSSGNGGGIANSPNAVSFTLGNSIVAGNTASGDVDADGGFASQGFNLIGEVGASTGWIAQDLTGTTAAPVSAELAPLADYGGLTLTQAPLAGSPAIDAGSNALIPAGVNTDQRGLARIFNGAVDIGADEYAVTTPAASTTTLTSLSPNPAGVDTTIAISGAVASSSGAGAAPTGSVTIYNGSASMGSATVQSNGTFTFSTHSLPPGTNLITASYNGDSAYAASTSSPISETVIASSVVPTFGKLVLPASVIAGVKFVGRLPVTITNHGSALNGSFTINLYADMTGGLDGNQSLLATVKQEVSLKTGKAKSFNFTLRSFPSSLPAGTYYLLAEAVDPTGAAYTTAATQSVQVAAPLISLAASVGSVTPANISAGKSGSILVTVMNDGNEDLTGMLDLTLSPSADGTTPLATALAAHRATTTIKAGQTRTFTLHLKIPHGVLGAGSYFPYLSVSLEGVLKTVIGATAFTIG